MLSSPVECNLRDTRTSAVGIKLTITTIVNELYRIHPGAGATLRQTSSAQLFLILGTLDGWFKKLKLAFTASNIISRSLIQDMRKINLIRTNRKFTNQFSGL